jgi:Na+/H+ antiporter NhaD/arsenite permease-like protein
MPIFILFLITFIAVFVDKHGLLKKIDYSLLATFIFFFIFIGNMGRLEVFRNFLSSILEGNEMLVAILSSQIISNVPAALLLSGFTDKWTALIIGTNLGGLGTLIASMASLISYKQLAANYPDKKGRYMIMFTVLNIIFLAVLYVTALVLG